MALELPPGFPAELQPLAAEIHTYFRHLPQLLDDDADGRFVVVKGDAVFGVWDTYRDAIEAGHERFEDGAFLAQQVDGKLLDTFGEFFGAARKPVSEVA
jgi:hypothetical protein